MSKRSNTAATHFNHVDRVHAKRVIELATGVCESATDVGKMTFGDCIAEDRALGEALDVTQRQLLVAKREGRTADVELIGIRIQAINLRKQAISHRRAELSSNRIGEGKRFLKAAIHDILTDDQKTAVFQRAHELETGTKDALQARRKGLETPSAMQDRCASLVEKTAAGLLDPHRCGAAEGMPAMVGLILQKAAAEIRALPSYVREVTA
jgi:hypothetical protein